jgi:ribonuclease P protein component
MPAVQRLTSQADFAAARREGRSWSDHVLVLVARPNGLDVTRAGYSVGKRVGNAVVRNRTKRLLRESVRHASIQDGWDLVFIARKDASGATFHDVERSVSGLMHRAGVAERSQDAV